jgi:hypothetical protein
MGVIGHDSVTMPKAIVKDGLLKEENVELQSSNRGFEMTSPLCSQAEHVGRRNENSTPARISGTAIHRSSNAW